MTVNTSQRYTRSRTCPICGGFDQAPRGQGARCFGFLSEDGHWAHCTREEQAGQVPFNANSETYAHLLKGDCYCGVRHDPNPPSRNGAQPEARIVTTHDYQDEGGELLYQEVRYDPKSFKVRRPDGKGDWIWKLGSVRRVLYNLPALMKAEPSETVYIVEGAKDVDRLGEVGVLATTNALGAKKWRSEYNESIEGRNVIILPDNDDDGRAHADQVAHSLLGKARTIKMLELPGLPEKGDVSDWLDASHTVEELKQLADETPPWEPWASDGEPPSDAAAFKAEALDDLLAGEDEPLDAIIGDGGDGAVLSVGGKGLVAGPTGVGKTNALLRGSRSFCEASPFLGMPVPKPRTVLYVALEGSPRAMKRRLRKIWAGADTEARSRFFMAHLSLNLGEQADLARLDALIDTIRPDVLIIDPLRNAHPWDENISHEMAKLTAILDGIIDRHGCAIICAHHDRKRPPFTRRDVGTDRVRGSTALTGWLNFCLSLDLDPSGPDRLLAEWTKTRDAEAALPPLTLDFDRDTIDFIPSERAPDGAVSDDAILTAVYHAGGSIRGTDLIHGFVEGTGAGERRLRERIRALAKAGQLVEYVAAEDSKVRAKSYRLPDAEQQELEV